MHQLNRSNIEPRGSFLFFCKNEKDK